MDLAPSASWITEDQLKNFWISDENSRTAGRHFNSMASCTQTTRFFP